jgi:hypothetical protein
MNDRPDEPTAPTAPPPSPGTSGQVPTAPEPPEPPARYQPDSPRPPGLVGGIMVAAGGVVLAAGAWQAFAKVDDFGDETSSIDAFGQSGIDRIGDTPIGDPWLAGVAVGRVMVVLGLAFVVAGLVLAAARSRRVTAVLAVVTALLAPVTVAVLFADLAHLTDQLEKVARLLSARAAESDLPIVLAPDVEVSAGRGLWVGVFGAGVALVGSLWALFEVRRKRPSAGPTDQPAPAGDGALDSYVDPS